MVMRTSDIKGLNAQQIQEKFALPYLPTHQVDATIPQGNTIRASTAGSAFGQSGGGVQFEVLSKPQSSWFNNPRSLK